MPLQKRYRGHARHAGADRQSEPFRTPEEAAAWCEQQQGDDTWTEEYWAVVTRSQFDQLRSQQATEIPLQVEVPDQTRLAEGEQP